MTLNLDRLIVIQREQKEWEEANFGVQPAWRPSFGMFEEVGEIASAFLKIAQKIRGSEEEHRAKLADAIGDTLVFLCGYANRRNFELAELLAFSPPRAPKTLKGFPDMDAGAVQRMLARNVFIRVGKFIEADSMVPEHWCVGESVSATAYVAIMESVVALVDDLSSLAIGVLGSTSQDCLEIAWSEVKERKWNVNPFDGKVPVNTDEDAPKKKAPKKAKTAKKRR